MKRKLKKLNTGVKFCYLIILATFFLGLTFAFLQKNNVKWINDHEVVEWSIDGKEMNVEVVNTPTSIEKGLSDRDKLDSDGMLFVFPTSVKASFWMTDMKFPIDLYWIKDGKIIGVEENMLPPEEGAPVEEMRMYDSPGYVDMVLEIPVEKNIDFFK
jgi:uncharacterized membrane protein (UPF0127 family)